MYIGRLPSEVYHYGPLVPGIRPGDTTIEHPRGTDSHRVQPPMETGQGSFQESFLRFRDDKTPRYKITRIIKSSPEYPPTPDGKGKKIDIRV